MRCSGISIRSGALPWPSPETDLSHDCCYWKQTSYTGGAVVRRGVRQLLMALGPAYGQELQFTCPEDVIGVINFTNKAFQEDLSDTLLCNGTTT